MRPSNCLALLLGGILLVLQGCCCLGDHGSCCSDGDHAAATAAATLSKAHRRACTAHPEPAFDLTVTKPPGPGLVYGTGDYDGAGAVLIKLQVQAISSVEGTEATVTAWSGNGNVPANPASFPPASDAYFTTGGDVVLPYWTSHILRDYVPSTNAYWVAVKVDYKLANGQRQIRYFFWTWTPSTTPYPDTLRNFNEYPS